MDCHQDVLRDEIIEIIGFERRVIKPGSWLDGKSDGRNITITPVYQIMPRYISIKINVPARFLSARVFFPLDISLFYSVVYVYTQLEKSSRIFIMMNVF